MITKSLSTASEKLLAFVRSCLYTSSQQGSPVTDYLEEEIMKTWTKPEVREQEVGLEVTSYLPAEIDLI